MIDCRLPIADRTGAQASSLAIRSTDLGPATGTVALQSDQCVLLADRMLLNFHVACRTNAQLLSLSQTNIFPTLTQDTSRPYAGADSGTNRSTASATRNQSDDGADACGPANLLHIASCGIASLDAALGIDFADALAAAIRDYFNHLRVQFGRAPVRHFDLIKSKLQLRGALCLARSLDLSNVTADDRSVVGLRLKHAHLKWISVL